MVKNPQFEEKINRDKTSGEFLPKPETQGLPSSGSITPPYKDTDEDPQDVAALYDFLDGDGDDAQQVEFELGDGTKVTGWAVDDARIPREGLPEHWHAYSVAEDETDEPDTDLMQAKGIDPDTADDGDIDYKTVLRVGDDIHVNHRFDFATTQQLTNEQLQQMSSIGDEQWGFTGERLSDHVYDNGIDPDIYREERRKLILGKAAENAMRDDKPTTGKIDMLDKAAHANSGVSVRGDSTITPYAFAKTTHPGDLPGLADVPPERISEMTAPDFKPDRPYIHWNADGDLETVTAKQRENLLWRNRISIILAAKDDDDMPPAVSNRLAQTFNDGE